MRVGLSGAEDFIAPWFSEMLGDTLVLIETDDLKVDRKLDAKLAQCTCLIHLNGHPRDAGQDRKDPKIIDEMRDSAKSILNAKNRHQGLHVIMIGSLRVHRYEKEERYTSGSALFPRDSAATGQLWAEERALEHASDTHPVSVIRTSNIQGVSVDSGEGRGVIHNFVNQASFGWIGVPGDGEDFLDPIHITDFINAVMTVVENPPPTRETIALGGGQAVPISEIANTISGRIGCDIQLWDKEENYVLGQVDEWEMKERMKFAPEVSIADMIEEAIQSINS
mgnify:CR=1 FL=1